MKKNNAILAVLTAAAVVLSSGIMVFAAADTTGTDDVQGFRSKAANMCTLDDNQREAVQQARADSMKEALASLVDSGTISQDIADQLPEFGMRFKAGIRNLTEEQKNERLESCPAGLLTDDQRTELHEAMKSIFESKLADLVDNDTITQEQADQLLQDKGAMRMGPGGRKGFGGRPGFEGRPDCKNISNDTETL